MHISSAAISCILRLSHDMSERPGRKGQVSPWSPTGVHQPWNSKLDHSAVVLHGREASEFENRAPARDLPLVQARAPVQQHHDSIHNPQRPPGGATSHSRSWSNSLTEMFFRSASLWGVGLERGCWFLFS